MKIWNVEGFNNFYGQNLKVLGSNFEEAKKVVANHYGLNNDEVGKCFVIEFYTSL